MIEVVIEQRQRSLGGFEIGRLLPFTSVGWSGPSSSSTEWVRLNSRRAFRIPWMCGRIPYWLVHRHLPVRSEIMHRDSVGSEQPIRPDEVNWMTAGRGITHSERFERARREGGRMNGIQAWVALPEAEEERDPAFAHHDSLNLPSFDERGVWGRLVAGDALGLHAEVETHSPMFYLHWEFAAEAQAELPADYTERAVYVAAGTIEVGVRVSRRARCWSSLQALP